MVVRYLEVLESLGLGHLGRVDNIRFNLSFLTFKSGNLKSSKKLPHPSRTTRKVT